MQLRAATETKIETDMVVNFARDPRRLVYAKGLEKLYQEVEDGHLSMF